MNPNLVTIDSAFCDKYHSLFDIQSNIFTQLKNYHFDLSKSEITQAIINRMNAFWSFNVRNNKELLGREINSQASDFLTETCLLFIKSYFGNRFDVKSEVSIGLTSQNKRNIIRPDISIWDKNTTKLVAVIEVKVSNGYKGKDIHSHLKEREELIQNIDKDCFFGVIAFWNFFDTNAPEFNKKYIGLKQFEKKEATLCPTLSQVENLLASIEEHLKNIFKNKLQ